MIKDQNTSANEISNRFLNLGQLGRGSFGVVQKVKCLSNNLNLNIKNGSYYAIKQIQLNQHNSQDILNEINAYKSMNSNYVVKYFSDFKNDKYHNIILELCQNKSLKDFNDQYIKNQKHRSATNRQIQLHENIIWKIFIQICIGLNHIHQQNYIHRDLKCDNILISKQKVAKIGDLGLALNLQKSNQIKRSFCQANNDILADNQNKQKNSYKINTQFFYSKYLFQSGDSNLLDSLINSNCQYQQYIINEKQETQSCIYSKDFVGTPLYISPEIYTQSRYSKASDVWALGIILYKLLNGYYPFEQNLSRTLEQNICESKPKQMLFGISKDLSELVFAMLQKNYEKRIKLEQIILSNKFQEMSQKLKINLPFGLNKKKISENQSFNLATNIFTTNKFNKQIYHKQLSNDNFGKQKACQIFKQKMIPNQIQKQLQNYKRKLSNFIIGKQNLKSCNKSSSQTDKIFSKIQISITQFKISFQDNLLENDQIKSEELKTTTSQKYKCSYQNYYKQIEQNFI